METETLELLRERLTELGKEIEEEIGESDKPLHAEAAMQEFPGDTREKTALYRKLQRAEKLLAEDDGEEALKVMRQEDQAFISEEGRRELEDLATGLEEELE